MYSYLPHVHLFQKSRIRIRRSVFLPCPASKVTAPFDAALVVLPSRQPLRHCSCCRNGITSFLGSHEEFAHTPCWLGVGFEQADHEFGQAAAAEDSLTGVGSSQV